jgi:predicted ATP-grasp superfamily ATP-dependent carboligase
LLVRSVEDLEPARDWHFPVVVKDRYSIRWSDEVAISGSVKYGFNWEELSKTVADRLSSAGEVLLQRFAAGTGIGLSAFVVDREIRVPFQWRRIREKDPRGSGSSARQSIPLEPDVVEYSQALLKRTGIEGIAMVEFKRNTPKETLSLMEINGRPWGSMHLPICCGVDYPRWLAEWYLEGRLPPETANYRTWTTCRGLLADLVHLENLWQGPPPGWPAPYPSFVRNLLAVAVPWRPGLKYEELMMGDLRPGISQLGQWLRQRFSRRT